MNTCITKETGKCQNVKSSFFLVMMLAWILLLAGQATCFAETVALSWDPNTETTLAGYKVYYKADTSAMPFNGTGAVEGASPIDVHNQANATISGLDPNKTYYFAITAYDTSGVESSYSNIVTISGLTSLTTAITAPANNATVSGTVSVTASASDNLGVSKVEFYVNGVLQATDTVTPYVYSWNTSALASGTYTLMTKAFNAAGNVSQSSNVVVSIVNDTIAPTVSITAPGNSSTVGGTVAITASASDSVGVSKVEFYSNGTLLFAGNVAPYTYSWNTKTLANGSYILTAKAYDNAGNIGQSSNTSVTVFNDSTAPTVTLFTIPATASSTTVAVTAFTATDNAAVTGYLVSESATAPAASAAGWTASAPTSFTFSAAGSKTAYAWAKDAAGNISASRSAVVSISLPDVTAPVIGSFTMPATAIALSVPVSSITATDAVGVTGYLISESATAPVASAAGWTASAPTSFTFSAAGSKTAYAWAKDAAGNVSLSRSAVVAITISSDVTAPVISTFIMPSTASSLTVAVSSFTASDAVGVTGYMITESLIAPAANTAGWTTSAPTSFTFSAAGGKVAVAWAKDAAGNVSSARVVFVTVTISIDTTAPVVSAFSMPATATALSIPISSLTATDAVGVTGYLITESATAPAASTAGWTASAPTSFIFSAAGSKTAYAWAKDAAGNVSASRSAAVTITLPVAAVNTLNINDALTALQIVVGRVQPTSDQIARLDAAPYINGSSQPDGKIDIGDVIVILGKVTGKIVL